VPEKRSGASSSLAGIEERIRRKLGEAGLIEAGFKAEAIPVIIAEDITGPGSQSYRGRRWSSGGVLHTLTAGALSSEAWQAVNPMVLTEVVFNPRDTLANNDLHRFEYTLHYGAPGTVPSYAVATVSGLFTEIAASNADRPGILYGQGGTWAITGAWEGGGAAPNVSTRVPLNAFLPAGAFFAVNYATDAIANGTIYVTLRGRVY